MQVGSGYPIANDLWLAEHSNIFVIGLPIVRALQILAMCVDVHEIVKTLTSPPARMEATLTALLELLAWASLS